jgi:hypothetical protein
MRRAKGGKKACEGNRPGLRSLAHRAMLAGTLDIPVKHWDGARSGRYNLGSRFAVFLSEVQTSREFSGSRDTLRSVLFAIARIPNMRGSSITQFADL